MGFLNKVFGSKEKKPETIETTLELLPTLIEKNFEVRKKELEMDSAKNISEIKYLHSKSLKLLEDIKKQEIEEKGNKRFNKAADTSKKQIEKQLEKLLLKMDPSDRGNTLEDVKSYSGEGNSLLVSEIMTFRKNIAYTSAYLKDEMKALGEALQGLLNNFSALQQMLDKEKEMFEFEKIKEKINTFSSSELENISNKIKDIENNIKEKDEMLKEAQEKKKNIISGDGMVGLAKLEADKASLATQKQELKTEVSSLMSTIDRPLQRFSSLVASGRWVLDKESQDILNGMITNPMLALKKDPSGEKFKSILGEVVKAIEDEKIELKDREKEKRLGALTEMLTFNFFEKVFWKLNDIQKKQSELEHQLKENTTQKELETEENTINTLQREKEELLEKKRLLEKEKSEINQKSREETQKIIDFSEKILGKKVIIKN